VIRGCAGAVQKGRYAGRQVLILLCKGHQSGEGSARIYSTYTTRIYLDRQTLLPLADMTTGTSYSKPAHDSATYLTSLVAPSSLPANFFQPSSIGYRGRADQIRQEMKPVPHGFTVLWLGLDFARRQGVPALSLQRVLPVGGGTSFAIYLHYAPAKNTGSDSLQLYEMSADDPNRPQPPPGSTRQTVKLANGHGVIVSGRDHMAFAYIGSTVALIQASAPALSSAQALRTIVRGLRPYVPNR
jgi:hypothetical protein